MSWAFLFFPGQGETENKHSSLNFNFLKIKQKIQNKSYFLFQLFQLGSKISSLQIALWGWLQSVQRSDACKMQLSYGHESKQTVHKKHVQCNNNLSKNQK